MKLALKACLALAVCLATAKLLLPQSAADDPLDSLKVCKDTQKLIFENEFVRVIDDQIPPGVTEPMHRHRHSVSVYLGNYTNENTTQDGKKTTQTRKANTAGWSEATVHSVRNVDTVTSHAIRIELKY